MSRIYIPQEELQRLHDVEGLSQSKLASYFGVSVNVIHRRIHDYNIQPHDGGFGSRQYTLNEEFFDTWTPESSWVYGWALGDGNFTTRKELCFMLSEKDEEVLYKLSEVLGSNAPIKNRDALCADGMLASRPASRIRFHSMKLATSINELSYMDIPYKYFSHFARGFFEAEGSVYWHRGMIESSMSQNDEDMLDFIRWCLTDLNVVKGGWLHRVGINKEGWKLGFSVRDTVSLYHYMYDNCGNMFLKRKKEKMEEMINEKMESVY